MPTLYDAKRLATYPRIAYMRRKERHQSEFMRRALELTNYRRSAYDFIGARMEDNDILYRADVNEDSVVIDVGGYVGSWCLAISRLYASTVYSFELSPSIYTGLAEATSAHPNIHAIGYGLSSHNETLPISRRGMGSSVYHSDSPEGWDDGQLRDVAEVWDELDLGRVNLMKINIEGGEYDLLERMDEVGLLDRVDCFMIQFHEWIPKAYKRRRGIRAALARTHDVAWDYPFVWERWDRRAVIDLTDPNP